MSNNWKRFTVKIQPLTNMHIGNLSYGFINKTKFYIPFYTIHSAFNFALFAMFKEKNIKEKFVSSSFCFYYKDNEKLISEDELKRNFLVSQTSTAIDNKTRTAKKSKLFNIESISPTSKINNRKLIAKGVFFIHQDILDKILFIIEKKLIRIGGEAKTGYGKVRISLQEEEFSVERYIPKGSPVLELIKLDEKNKKYIIGDKEVVFTRKTRNSKVHGNWRWYEGLFFSPFSTALEDIRVNLLHKQIINE